MVLLFIGNARLNHRYICNFYQVFSIDVIYLLLFVSSNRQEVWQHKLLNPLSLVQVVVRGCKYEYYRHILNIAEIPFKVLLLFTYSLNRLPRSLVSTFTLQHFTSVISNMYFDLASSLPSLAKKQIIAIFDVNKKLGQSLN